MMSKSYEDCVSQSPPHLITFIPLSLLCALRSYLVASSVLPRLTGYQQEKENRSCKKLHFLSLEMFPIHWLGMVWQAVGRERLYTFTHHQLFKYVIKTILLQSDKIYIINPNSGNTKLRDTLIFRLIIGNWHQALRGIKLLSQCICLMCQQGGHVMSSHVTSCHVMSEN